MERTPFYDMLNPMGSTYSTKIKQYRAIKEMSREEVIKYLENNFTHAQLMHLLAEFIETEVNYEKVDMPRIRISQEQFDAFFRIIKPHSKRESVGDFICEKGSL